MLRKLINTVIDTPLQTPTAFPHPFTKKETLHLSWLTQLTPCFPISAKNISILYEPADFYNALLEYGQKAKERITIASLYLGNGDLEKKLVKSLMDNSQLSQLKINILLDYARGSRFANNSRKMLQPLLQQSSSCTLSLYHTPTLRGVLKKVMPNRWNELFGVQHMKLYIFDDTLIISGANLSNDYFTNRQDRYFVIKDNNLCDFYDGLIKRVQKFSIKVDENDSEEFGEYGSPYEGSKNNFIEKAGDGIEKYLAEVKVDQNNHKHEGFDTWIFPLVQMGQLGVVQDVQVTARIFGDALPGTRMNIATAYFNLTHDYVRSLIFKSKAECNLLMAHPEANGFLGAKGMAGGIPDGYTLLARRFKAQLDRQCQQNRIHLLEYIRKGWTYHAKGLWYYSPGSEKPSMTLIGSPNFGDRSVLKDLETQIAIVTENPELQEKLHDECTRLYKLGLRGDFKREVPHWVYAMVFLFKDFF